MTDDDDDCRIRTGTRTRTRLLRRVVPGPGPACWPARCLSQPPGGRGLCRGPGQGAAGLPGMGAVVIHPLYCFPPLRQSPPPRPTQGPPLGNKGTTRADPRSTETGFKLFEVCEVGGNREWTSFNTNRIQNSFSTKIRSLTVSVAPVLSSACIQVQERVSVPGEVGVSAAERGHALLPSCRCYRRLLYLCDCNN